MPGGEGLYREGRLEPDLLLILNTVFMPKERKCFWIDDDKGPDPGGRRSPLL